MGCTTDFAFGRGDILGLVGSLCVVLAYFLNQSGRLATHDPRYSLMNLAGSLSITGSLLIHFNLASFVIEVFWISISVMGLFKAYRLRHANS